MDNKQQKDGGYLAKNKKKTTPKQPDYRGKALYKGKEVLVSAWVRMKDGEELITFLFSDPEEVARYTQGNSANTAGQDKDVRPKSTKVVDDLYEMPSEPVKKVVEKEKDDLPFDFDNEAPPKTEKAKKAADDDLDDLEDLFKNFN